MSKDEIRKGVKASVGAVAFDLQGTLCTVGFKLADGSILTQAEALRKGRMAEVYANEYETVPVVNGEYAHVTIEQLKRLKHAGVLLYIATGDGGGEYQDGAMTPERLIEGFGVPIPRKNVVNWHRLEQEGFERRFATPAENGKSDKKNDLLDFICQNSGLEPADLQFFDDGPGNVNGAKRFGVKQATQVDQPAHLTDGLNALLEELGLEPVPVEPPAPQTAEASKSDEGTTSTAELTDLRLDLLLMPLLAFNKNKNIDPGLAQKIQKVLKHEGAVELAKLCKVFVGLHNLTVKYGKPTLLTQQSTLVRTHKAQVCQRLLKTLRRMIGRYGQGDKYDEQKKVLQGQLGVVYNNGDPQNGVFAGINSDLKNWCDELSKVIDIPPSTERNDSNTPSNGGT